MTLHRPPLPTASPTWPSSTPSAAQPRSNSGSRSAPRPEAAALRQTPPMFGPRADCPGFRGCQSNIGGVFRFLGPAECGSEQFGDGGRAVGLLLGGAVLDRADAADARVVRPDLCGVEHGAAVDVVVEP